MRALVIANRDDADAGHVGERLLALEATLDELMPRARVRCHALVDRFLSWASLPLKGGPPPTDRQMDHVEGAPGSAGAQISLVSHAPGQARGTTRPGFVSAAVHRSEN